MVMVNDIPDISLLGDTRVALLMHDPLENQIRDQCGGSAILVEHIFLQCALIHSVWQNSLAVSPPAMGEAELTWGPQNLV